ncbi:MAG TPA: hypothetical protein VK184_22335, partial [Nostocaceae cyanobacterium]|nr:hypothetical protein [Nostocaceae cyanobacterium]
MLHYFNIVIAIKPHFPPFFYLIGVADWWDVFCLTHSPSGVPLAVGAKAQRQRFSILNFTISSRNYATP